MLPDSLQHDLTLIVVDIQLAEDFVQIGRRMLIEAGIVQTIHESISHVLQFLFGEAMFRWGSCECE